MNEVLKNIESRCSTKSYNSKMPSSEQLDTIINAGICAASGRNMQSPIIVAITNKEIRDKLSAANAAVMGASGDPFYGAPAVLVVLAKKDVNTHVYDGSLCLGNMMLAAHSLGLGSCWVHRAKEVFENSDWKKFLTDLGINYEVEGIGNLIVGYPEGDAAKPKSRLPGRVYKVD